MPSSHTCTHTNTHTHTHRDTDEHHPSRHMRSFEPPSSLYISPSLLKALPPVPEEGAVQIGRNWEYKSTCPCGVKESGTVKEYIRYSKRSSKIIEKRTVRIERPIPSIASSSRRSTELRPSDSRSNSGTTLPAPGGAGPSRSEKRKDDHHPKPPKSRVSAGSITCSTCPKPEVGNIPPYHQTQLPPYVSRVVPPPAPAPAPALGLGAEYLPSRPGIGIAGLPNSAYPLPFGASSEEQIRAHARLLAHAEAQAQAQAQAQARARGASVLSFESEPVRSVAVSARAPRPREPVWHDGHPGAYEPYRADIADEIVSDLLRLKLAENEEERRREARRERRRWEFQTGGSMSTRERERRGD